MNDRSAREVAFLRDQYIDNDWTARFTNLLDEHLILPEEGSLLYVEPGSGNHLLALPEKLHGKVELFSAHDDIELLRIAQAKAEAIKARVDFKQTGGNSFPFPDGQFTAVIADASLTPPKDLPALIAELNRVTKKDGYVSFFLPTAGSFGEFFSILWEALFQAGMEGLGPQVEELIAEIPQITQVEAIAEIAGLSKIKSETKSEFFDYENGADLMDSFLMTEFLLPRWLRFLTPEEKEKIAPEIIRAIDEDRAAMTFRLTVKATVVNGRKRNVGARTARPH
jgi:ubiquinone/menaquinone biosynthesis C-methylase UbiE